MKGRAFRSLALPVLAAALLMTSPARATDPSAADQAAADALFREAQGMIAAGRASEACPKFEAAQRLEPTVGTQLNLADCYERVGRTASAFGMFQDSEAAARKAGDKARQQAALTRAKALEGKLSRLTIVVAPASRPPGLEVKQDGRPVVEAMWGSAIPVDPGEHAMEAWAPGRVRWRGTAVVGPDGATAMIGIPELAAAPLPPGWWGAQRVAGVAMAGAGVAGAIVGAVFGARAISTNNASKASCSPTDPNLCDDSGVSLRHDAKTAGTVSTAALAAGGAMVVGGVVLFFTAPSPKPAETARIVVMPRVARGDVGLMIEGRW